MKFTASVFRSLFAIGFVVAALSARAQIAIPDEYKIGGFAIGCQAYSFNRFSLFEAIEKTEQTGGKIIELYPRHKLSPEQPTIIFNHDSPEEIIQQVKEKLVKHGIKVVNYGVVRGKDEAEWRRIFEFAKKMDMYGITVEDTKSIDLFEKLVKEFNICVGYHEHARKPSDPMDALWNPEYVAKLVKDRDPRIGACADTGHWQTSGLNALESIRLLKGRIISLHLKDRAALGAGQHDMIFGAGKSDVGAILDELKTQGFKGNISIEYEYNWENSVPDIAQCIGFVRGWAAKK